MDIEGDPEISLKDLFRSYSSQYDNFNEKHEKLVKLSRDTTIASKKLIFLLQRSPLDRIEKDALASLDKIKDIIKIIEEELVGESYLRFNRAYSPGFQEFIEAISFYHFLKHNELMSLDQIEDFLELKDTNTLRISLRNYLLGIADLTGELLRVCINAATSRKLDKCKNIRNFVRSVYNGFNSLNFDDKELPKKIETMNQSLIKIEQACVSLIVRTSEFPDAPFSTEVHETYDVQ